MTERAGRGETGVWKVTGLPGGVRILTFCIWENGKGFEMGGQYDQICIFNIQLAVKSLGAGKIEYRETS